MKTIEKTHQTQNPVLSLKDSTIQRVFAGTGKSNDPLTACADECISGTTANTQAMQATIP